MDCPDSIERFCISLNQEYFNNPKRFPYEDRKESTTVSDEQNGKSSYANRVARNKKKNGGRFDVMKLSKVYIEQLKNVYSNFGDFAKSIFESLDTAIYAAGLYGTDEDLKKYMFESLSKFFNFGQSASDRLKVAIANTVSAVPRVKEGTSSSSDDSNSAT